METQLLLDPDPGFGSQSLLSHEILEQENVIPFENMLPVIEATNQKVLPVIEAANQTLLPVIPPQSDLNCSSSFAPSNLKSTMTLSEPNPGENVPASVPANMTAVPNSPVNHNQDDLTLCEVNSVDAFDTSVQQDLLDFSPLQQDLVDFNSDLSSAQQDMADLSSAQQDMADLSSAQHDMADLSSVQQDIVDLSSVQQDMVALSSVQQDLADLSSVTQDIVDLSAEKDLADLSSAEQHLSDLSSTGQHLADLSSAEQHLADLSSTQQHLVDLSTTEQDLADLSSAQQDLADLSSAQQDLADLSTVQKDLADLSSVELSADVPLVTTHGVPAPAPSWSLDSTSGAFSPVESGLVAIPEDELLKNIETVPPMMGSSSQVPDSNESDVASEARTESNSTVTAVSANLSTGYPQFERAEAMTAKQQVALWLTRTSTSDLQQELSVPSLRSLVGPSKSGHRWHHKAKYRHMSSLISRPGSTPVKTIIKRNFSTKSLMERWSGSRDPVYCHEEPVMRKCKTTIALADIVGGHAHCHQQVPRRKKECRSTPQGSRRSLLFNRFSTEGIPFSGVCGGMGSQRTAPGDLYDPRLHEASFPGIRPINRLRSQSTIPQCSRCNSVMSVHTPRTNSRATSQISLLLDRSRRRDQDEVLCKICLMDYSPTLMVKLEDCGCTFCKECIQQYITFEVMEGAYDISCPDPDCLKQGILNQHQMERLTSKDLMDKHRTFRLNTEVSIDAGRTWCPSAGCDTICHICAGAKSAGVPVSCPTCTKEFCSLCSATWHPGITCAENGALLVKRGGTDVEPMVFDSCDGNIKRCPVCNVPIERDAGCAQMMCKRCKHVFCWYCLTSLDDDFLLRHYDSGACKGRLGHSRASVLWHRAQVIGIFAGFGILLLVASPLLLVMAPCIICCKCRACSKPEEASVDHAPSDYSSKASIKST